MQLFLLATGINLHEYATKAKDQIPQKFPCRRFDGIQAGKIKFEEDALFAGVLLQLFDGGFSLCLASRCNVHFCIVCE
jgi:hypothetical protein